MTYRAVSFVRRALLQHLDRQRLASSVKVTLAIAIAAFQPPTCLDLILQRHRPSHKSYRCKSCLGVVELHDGRTIFVYKSALSWRKTISSCRSPYVFSTGTSFHSSSGTRSDRNGSRVNSLSCTYSGKWFLDQFSVRGMKDGKIIRIETKRRSVFQSKSLIAIIQSA